VISTPEKTADAGARTFVPLCVPEIRGNEWTYVKECLDTAWVSSVGSFVDRFERELAGQVGTKHAVAAVNGTAALHVALLVAGIQPDDEVLVSTLTFVAPANAVRYAGAWPVFIDAEPDYWQMDAAMAADFLRNGCRCEGGEVRNRATGRRIAALLPVHILGHPCDMEPLLELAREYRLPVIEDATESLGARYQGRPVGTLGDIACFSFNGNKLLTTGGGGMIVTDNPAWAERAKYLTTQAKDDQIEYVHHAIGYNYRLTNVLAAMGCAQLEQIEPYLAAKRRMAAAYQEVFADLPGIAPMMEAPWAQSAWWLYTVRVDEREYGMDSRALLQALAGEQIQARPLWQPLHRSPAHAGAPAYRGEVADRLHRDCLSLPCSVGLRPEDQERVIEALRRFARSH
jgi:perosamine synthetase